MLGCPHFPYLSEQIKKAMGNKVVLTDPAIDLSRQLKTFLKNHAPLKKSLTKGENHRYFVSGDIFSFHESAKNILGQGIKNVSAIMWD